jgi:flagellar biosynthesis/type III secretory pathway M-ring protein FliF/YscJ
MVHDKLFWLEDYERYWFLARGDNIESNSYTTMSIEFEKTDDSQYAPFYIILLILIIILIISILLMKKFGFFKEEEIEQKNKDYSEKKIKELKEQKEKILSSIKRVEQEYKDNIISKEDYEQLRGAYKKRAVNILKEIDRLKE